MGVSINCTVRMIALLNTTVRTSATLYHIDRTSAPSNSVSSYSTVRTITSLINTVRLDMHRHIIMLKRVIHKRVLLEYTASLNNTVTMSASSFYTSRTSASSKKDCLII